MPVETVNVLCKVVFGLVLIGAGVYHILIFVLEKDNSTILDLFSARVSESDKKNIQHSVRYKNTS